MGTAAAAVPRKAVRRSADANPFPGQSRNAREVGYVKLTHGHFADLCRIFGSRTEYTIAWYIEDRSTCRERGDGAPVPECTPVIRPRQIAKLMHAELMDSDDMRAVERAMRSMLDRGLIEQVGACNGLVGQYRNRKDRWASAPTYKGKEFKPAEPETEENQEGEDEANAVRHGSRIRSVVKPGGRAAIPLSEPCQKVSISNQSKNLEYSVRHVVKDGTLQLAIKADDPVMPDASDELRVILNGTFRHQFGPVDDEIVKAIAAALGPATVGDFAGALAGQAKRLRAHPGKWKTIERVAQGVGVAAARARRSQSRVERAAGQAAEARKGPQKAATICHRCGGSGVAGADCETSAEVRAAIARGLPFCDCEAARTWRSQLGMQGAPARR